MGANKNIYLIRSAETIPLTAKDPGELHRSLTPTGNAQAESLRHVLSRIVTPSQVVHTSPTSRTRRTALSAVSFERPFIQIQTDERLNNSNPDDANKFLAELQESHQLEPVICFTHFDVIKSVVQPYALIDLTEKDIPTGSITELSSDGRAMWVSRLGISPQKWLDDDVAILSHPSVVNVSRSVLV